MGNELTAVADRLLAVNWSGSFDRTRSRATLMREYLRRAAWWARATASPDWPFFDIAAAVDPSVRADPQVVRRVLAQLDASLQGVQVQRAAERALHFAALLESGRPLPELPDSVRQPFEPLLQMFERGGGFRIEGSGLIEVDTAGLRRGTLEENLADQPVTGLDRLDDLD